MSNSILLNYHNGIPFDIELDVNWIAEIPNYPISPDDLYIVTYAKSGTTWAQQIVALIQRGGEKNQSHLMQVIPWLEIIGKEAAFALSPPRTLKSHLPYHMMPGRDPANSIGKYIYIARNPKDVAVSFYYHTKRHSEYNFTGDWDCYFELFIKGEVEFGLWFDHVLSWWRHKDAQNILFLKYEDLKKDLHGSVKTIAQFMGYSIDDATIDKIARQSTFESMKDDPLATIDSLPLKFSVVSGSTPFIRKGVIGDWKNHFTDEQSARFDAEYTKRMQDLMSSGSIQLLRDFDGFPFNPLLDANWIAQIPGYSISPGDLYIATYPKSGTTWTQQIVSLIQWGGEKDTHISSDIPWLESIGKDHALVLSPPRTLKTHLPYHMMPGRDPANSIGSYIYIARNPKDVAVSMYYHAKRYSAFEFTGDWDCFFELFMKGEVSCGLWFNHVLGWWDRKDAKNILFLKYEDLKKDLPGSVKTIAQFMGYSIDDATINKITRQSTFESMKDDPLANLPLGFPVVSGSTPFIRKGVIGDWKNHFTDEQSARFDAEYTKRMPGTGLVFDFE